MIITRLRLMFLAPIPILKKNHPLMNRLTVCDTLRQDHWWSEEIQLLLPLSHASMELAQWMPILPCLLPYRKIKALIVISS